MEFFRIRKDIPFMRYALLFNVISMVTFVLAVGALAMLGRRISLQVDSCASRYRQWAGVRSCDDFQIRN